MSELTDRLREDFVVNPYASAERALDALGPRAPATAPRSPRGDPLGLENAIVELAHGLASLTRQFNRLVDYLENEDPGIPRS